MALEGVRLKDCLEELLKFTLESSIDGTLELDLGLSKEYCSNLLKDDPSGRSEPESKPSSFSEGVPPYPLYKHLASALYQSITFGAFRRTENKMAGINDNNFLKQIGEWDGLVLNKGSEIVNMLRTVGFDLHVQEPFFSQLKVGLKTIEGRCASGDYNREKLYFVGFSPSEELLEDVFLKNCYLAELMTWHRIGPGDLIIFNKCLVFEVQGVCRYPSFHEMLEAEGLSKVLPGVEYVEAGVQIYRKFYTEEMERCSGVLAISVAKSSTQPYISSACLLSRFSYHGIQSLLGLGDTVGTVPEGVPPPRSALFSSFLLEHKPNVKSSILTVGARALAKHVNRSSSNWWGDFNGGDSIKNTLARDVISHIVEHCCWLNVHIVPQHGVVFETRVAEGYGARWSEDGKKFIGFLEPYMEDGHSKGWRH